MERASPSVLPLPDKAVVLTWMPVLHQQTLQAETTRGRGGGGGSQTAGQDVSPGPRYPHPESGSKAAEDRTRLSQIWTALGDLLPQTQVSLDKVSHENYAVCAY